MKALSIISVVFALIFSFWFLLFIDSNGRISVDEFAPIGIIFSIWNLAFSIVAIVVSFKKDTK